MKMRMTLVAVLAVTAGVLAYIRPHKAIPSDIRDAVADNAGREIAVAGQGPVWKHVVFQAADKTLINIDYAVARQDPDPNAGDGVVAYAAPLWITIMNPAYNGTEKVRVTIMEPTGWQPVDIDLEYVEDAGGKRFIGKSAQRITLVGRSNGLDYPKKVKEFSIAVNGVLLTDPVSDTRNFKFRMPWT